ncbi:ATP-binding cassette transporter [Mycena chlorophos]|uniref:ATP-binding cassette transporter n=1 Tax=Mycena chlorophos TaxID=658473 RepID=A0A8H6TIC3_MYCCL|nr:ATP-binding cassette transporter [Mycena chlorophos]
MSWTVAQASFSLSQVRVDTAVTAFSNPYAIWEDSLAIPIVTAAGSSVVLLLHLFLASVRKTPEQPDDSVRPPAGRYAQFRQHVANHGGLVIFTFKLLRLVACLTLLALSIASLVLTKSLDCQDVGRKCVRWHSSPSIVEWTQLGTSVVFLYASLLAVVSVVATRRWSQAAVKHLNVVLLAIFFMYVYRDVFPLVTYRLVPRDASEGWILWTKIATVFVAAIVVPLFIPRQYIPVDPKNPMPVPNPEQSASLFSLMFYVFLDPIILLGYRLRHITPDQLPPLADYDYAANIKAKNFGHLEATVKHKRHLFFGLLWTFRWAYVGMALSMIVLATMNFASPLGVNRLLNYLENPDVEPVIQPWIWILFLIIGPMTASTALQWYIYLATRTLVRCEAIITQLVFEHALRIRVKAESSDGTTSSGTSTPTRHETPSPNDGSVDEAATDGDAASQNETLQASSASVKSTFTDLTNITEGRDFLFVCLLIPLEAVISAIFLYQVLGWAAFVGMATMVLLFPVPGFVASKIRQVQQQRLKKTDARVQVVTETMNVLRMVKLFGWERQMNERVAAARGALFWEELVWLWKRQMLDLLNGSLNYLIPVVTMMATYATYTVIAKENLSASKVFSSMSVFDMLRSQLRFMFWALGRTVTGKVSLDRVNEFLHKTELLDQYAEPDHAAAQLFIPAEAEDSRKIGFRDATFAWTSEKIDGTLTPSRRRFLLKIDGELEFKPGCINLVVGPTGSGKTSLLMALLGTRNALYPVEALIVETIKENILFGAEYDEERYKKVLYQCALERDLELFDAGDATEVGEKGLTLSGGQKARVTLARAIYSNTEIILLDDVLAALDVHTSKWIVDKCFRGDLVKGRTIILVTHNVAMVKPIASFVVSMDVDGSIHSHDSVAEAFANDEVLAEELSKDQAALDKNMDEVDAKLAADGKLIVAEEVEEGHVSVDSLKLYSKGMSGDHALLFFSLFMVGMFAAEMCRVVQTWFLGLWANQYNTKDPGDVDVFYYLGIFCTLLIIAMTVSAISYVYYSCGVWRASKKIHEQLVDAVLGTTLRWLDITPTSRVITRCTVDIRQVFKTVDGPLAQGLWALVEMSVSMFVKFFAVMIFAPLFIFPGILVGVLGGWCGRMYIAAQLGVKREMSNAKAPVMGHFGASIAGLTSIRAYGAESSSIAMSLSRIDKYTRTARTFYNLNRWVCIRIDALGGLFVCLQRINSYLICLLILGRLPRSLTTLSTLRQTFNPSNVGFTLNMAIGFSGMVLWWVRVLNDFEIQGNSLERIRGYIEIEQEPKPTSSGVPPAYWPASGKLEVQGLSARYSVDGPKVLQDVSFEVEAGERVGIVGRTGSGKSSLTLALLRTIFTEGNVLYDDIPTSSLNLDALRNNITIIPQMPELLAGSLRKNLDLFDEFDDVTLNSALRSAGLFALQSEMDEGRITLDSDITAGGANLSVGQRQILALARALVRGSKLLILDEATSAIDYKTDTIIQSSLRNELPKDTTLLTVAHRLQTIMDSDKIVRLYVLVDVILRLIKVQMVLDAGKIVEFDTPAVLLQKKNGKLRALVDESGDRDALYKMAGVA